MSPKLLISGKMTSYTGSQWEDCPPYEGGHNTDI